ncbi:hypothetical protein EDB89DRAFT_1913327 [Lactarius sanguifluus]|nr:hypothetical protein EDB89DRAFT_1913327 [Lactarius sanguifluus]
MCGCGHCDYVAFSNRLRPTTTGCNRFCVDIFRGILCGIQTAGVIADVVGVAFGADALDLRCRRSCVGGTAPVVVIWWVYAEAESRTSRVPKVQFVPGPSDHRNLPVFNDNAATHLKLYAPPTAPNPVMSPGPHTTTTMTQGSNTTPTTTATMQGRSNIVSTTTVNNVQHDNVTQQDDNDLDGLRRGDVNHGKNDNNSNSINNAQHDNVARQVEWTMTAMTRTVTQSTAVARMVIM